MNKIELYANGIPKAQPRPKAFRTGKFVKMMTPNTADDWKQSVKDAWGELGIPTLPKDPIKVTMIFIMPRPRAHFRTNGEVKPTAPDWHTVKPDIDNLVKAVFDALSDTGAWPDDTIVAKTDAEKQYGEPPGCYIAIEECPKPTILERIWDVATSLYSTKTTTNND